MSSQTANVEQSILTLQKSGSPVVQHRDQIVEMKNIPSQLVNHVGIEFFDSQPLIDSLIQSLDIS